MIIDNNRISRLVVGVYKREEALVQVKGYIGDIKLTNFAYNVIKSNQFRLVTDSLIRKLSEAKKQGKQKGG